MKNYKVNISTGSVLNELLAIMAKNDESSLTIDSFNKIINNSEHIVDSDEIIARVKFSVNDCIIDFNDMIIAFNDLFTEIAKKTGLEGQQNEINRKIEQGIQNKIDGEYGEIFNEMMTIHSLIEANREKINMMYETTDEEEITDELPDEKTE